VAGITLSDLVTKVVVPVATIVTGFLAYDAQQLSQTANQRLQEQKHLLETQAEDRLKTESLQKFELQIYQIVTDSLSKGAVYQEAANALITSTLENPLRTAFLNVLASSDRLNPEAKREVLAALYNSQQAEIPSAAVTASPPTAVPPEVPAPAAGPLAGISIDVFWCEASGDSAKAEAEQIRNYLAAQGATGRLRTRILPTSINQRAGYNIDGLVIRYDQNEDDAAKKLKALADASVAGGVQFQLTRSAQNTQSYLSAFVCPKADG